MRWTHGQSLHWCYMFPTRRQLEHSLIISSTQGKPPKPWLYPWDKGIDQNYEKHYHPIPPQLAPTTLANSTPLQSPPISSPTLPLRTIIHVINELVRNYSQLVTIWTHIVFSPHLPTLYYTLTLDYQLFSLPHTLPMPHSLQYAPKSLVQWGM